VVPCRSASSHRRRRQRSLKTDVVWCVVGYLFSQVLLNIFVDWRHPELFDTEYGARLSLLKARIAENPGKPLLLAVGSSRVGEGFEPELLSPLETATGEQALPFNFSHLAAGPIMNLVTVRRLLREGIHPTWVVLELAPTCMSHEKYSMPATMASAADAVLLPRYFNPWLVWSVYLRGRTNPWYTRRVDLLRRYLPRWSTLADATDVVSLEPLGGDRRWMAVTEFTPEETRRRTDFVRTIYFSDLQHYHVDAACDRATHDLLDLCRRERIQVVLMLTPEGSEFRGWYSPETHAHVQQYVAELSHQYGVPVVDAREWSADDDFQDSHHLLKKGAVQFTRRLGRDVLQPLVAGRLGENDDNDVALRKRP
jgi:hypothetical protein